MTVQQASHFNCDRCKAVEIVPTDSGGPAINRAAGPMDWTMLRLGPDPSTPPSHLCPECSSAFANFMATKVS